MLVATFLGFLGLCFGSFVNALVWRLRQTELKAQSSKPKAKNSQFPIPNSQFSILTGRSVCPRCHHELAWYDLIPLLSWLFLRGRCRYCHRPISWQYPLVEATMAAVFVISYFYWSGGIFGVGDWLLFITWLAASVGLMALLVYDLRWMILSDRLIYPTLAVAVFGRLLYILSFEPDKLRSVGAWLLSVAIASGLFWVIFQISKGRWIGYGDVRLGWILGTILAEPALSVLMIFTASLLGSIVALPLLATGRKTITSRLPYGPFLIAATFLVLLYGQQVITWYKNLLS